MCVQFFTIMFSLISVQASQSKLQSRTLSMPDQQIQSQFDHHNSQIKGFIDSFEDFKDIIKKYHSAIHNFGSSLSEVSKRERSADQPLESINCQLITFLGLFSQNIKSIASHTLNQLETVRSKLDGLKEFKVQMKKNYEDQNKQYQKLKKEYQQSKEKMDDIKNKLDDFQKLNDQRDPQFILLKHEFKYATHEVKARQQNKLECNQAFQSFMLNLIVEKDNILENYVIDSQNKIESNFKCFKDVLLQSYNKFEMFLKPLVQEISSKVSEQAKLSQISAQDNQSSRQMLDDSIQPSMISDKIHQRKKSPQSKSIESKILLNITNSNFSQNSCFDPKIISSREITPKQTPMNRFDQQSGSNSSTGSIKMRQRYDISQKTTALTHDRPQNMQARKKSIQRLHQNIHSNQQSSSNENSENGTKFHSIKQCFSNQSSSSSNVENSSMRGQFNRHL